MSQPINKFTSEVEAADSLHATYKRLSKEISKVIIGQDEVVKLLLISLFSQGHSLLIGVPGLAKTLLINTIASALDLKFNRIQFTPDLMPSDILGTSVYDLKKSEFEKYLVLVNKEYSGYCQ